MGVNRYGSRFFLLAMAFFGHLYVFWNISSKATLYRTRCEILTAFLGTLGISIIMLKIRLPSHYLFRWLFLGISLWFAFFYVAFFCALAAHLLHALRMISHRIKFPLILLLTTVIFVYGLVNAYVFNVRQFDIPVKGLKSELRIAHLSDLHLGSIYQRGFVERICQKVEELAPDFVVITGDLFDGNIAFEYEMIKPFDKLKCPVYFVMGNHDMLYEDEAHDVLRQSKIIYLNDNTTQFRGLINILGIDYTEGATRRAIRKLKTLNTTQGLPNLLLYHSPSISLGTLAENKIAVQLAGHTHGGQVYPMQLAQLLNYDYLSGVYREGETSIYVSPGIGTTGMPMRIGTEPVIAVIHLTPS